MSVKIFENQEVQDFLRTAAGLTNEGGSPRAKEIVRRIISAGIKAEGLEGPFAEIVFDFELTALVDGEDNQLVHRPRLAA